MKKTIIYILTALMLSLCACQKTPDTEAVINKGDNKAQKAIEASPDPAWDGAQPVFPERWEDDILTSYAEMVIDADVIASEQTKMPVHIVGKHRFTSDEVTRIANSFFSNMSAVQEGTGQTREEYEKALKAVSEMDIPQESKEIQTDMLNGEIIHASVREEYFKPAKSFESKDFPDGKSSQYIVKQTDGRNGVMVFIASENILTMCKTALAVVQTKDMVEPDGGYIGERNAVVEPSITLEDAVKVAEDFLNDIGANGFSVAQSEKARLLDSCYLSVLSSGWELQFTRSFGYAAINAATRDAVNGLKIGEVFGESEYNAGWKCEWIDIYVSDKGVEFIEYHDPMTDGGVVNENVKLMDFESISETIKRYFTARMSGFGEKNSYYYSIDKLVLTVVPVQRMDSDDAYMMPVWVCEIGDYRSLADVYSEVRLPGKQERFDWHTVVFNAIDGSRIAIER